MSKTLLLADDSVVIQKLVGLSFANEDVEIVSTDNGDDAVTKAREIRPDVVLADVVMPGKSGYEVCEAIKQDAALAHIPVLLLTGTFEAFDETRAQAAGATGHITKPFEAQALVERVKAVIQNATANPVASATTQQSGSRSGVGRASAPARDFEARSPLQADDLFADDDRSLSSSSNPSLFGAAESLDVTPSLGEDDLSDALDPDLFGLPGDVGGTTTSGGESFSAGFESLELSEPMAAGPELGRSKHESTEEATTAYVAEAFIESVGSAATGGPEFAAEFGLDDPIEVAPFAAAAFDLDSAFDPEPPPAPVALGFARDDANAATSRSLDRSGVVTDLDEFLATPPPVPTEPRSALRPEAPMLLDLGPAEQSRGDLDFGFDVSEQATISNVDLLEESFSSLLDVSDSQILGESMPSLGGHASPFESAPPSISHSFADLDASSATPARIGTPPPFEPAPTPTADFDVSSSDLATTTLSETAAPPIAPPLAPSTSANPAFERPMGEVPPPLPESALSSRTRRTPSVDDMSPILQQQVQETLEKVAWEAFSDLSETIVKQVIERVERIAWEVIPQMAETLVREEIRKMKGDVD